MFAITLDFLETLTALLATDGPSAVAGAVETAAVDSGVVVDVASVLAMVTAWAKA